MGGIVDASSNGVVELFYSGSANNSTFTVKTAVSTSYSFNGIMRDKFSGTPTGRLSFAKDGPGTQILTGSNITYTGNTTVLGGLLDVPNLNTPNADVTVAGGAKLIATSIVANSLTVAAGGLVEIRPIPGGPLAGSGGMTAVPEPSTWIMLMLAAMGLGIYRRRRR